MNSSPRSPTCAHGASWEAVALDLGQPAEAIRRWSDDYPELWHRRHGRACRTVLSECLAEACLTLCNHLRPKNSIRDQREAAG